MEIDPQQLRESLNTPLSESLGGIGLIPGMPPPLSSNLAMTLFTPPRVGPIPKSKKKS